MIKMLMLLMQKYGMHNILNKGFYRNNAVREKLQLQQNQNKYNLNT